MTVNPKLKPFIGVIVVILALMSVSFILIPGCTVLVERNREAKIAAYTGDGEIRRTRQNAAVLSFLIDLDQANFSKPYDRRFRLSNLPGGSYFVNFMLEFQDTEFRREILDEAHINVKVYNAQGEESGSFSATFKELELNYSGARLEFRSMALTSMLTNVRDNGELNSVSVQYTPPNPAAYSREYTIRLECNGHM